MSDVPSTPGVSNSPASRSLRVLLADDSQATQASVRGMLVRFGHRVDVVSNGLEALRAVEREDYDAVLMDIRMPEMDGLEAARKLCALRPRSHRPPIIALSDSATLQERERCLATGMDDFLAKPVNSRTLVEALVRSASAASGTEPASAPVRTEDAQAGSSGNSRAEIAPIQVVVDGMLGELRVWSESEWAMLPEASCPKTVVYMKGLGWVGVVSRVALN